MSVTVIRNKHFTFVRNHLVAFASVALAAGAGCITDSLDDTAHAAASQPAVVPLPLPVAATSYKVLIYNVQLRPVTACIKECDSEIYNMSNETRAGLIATKLLADDPDIIVLNEPFHNNARNVLVEQLSLRYPTVVDALKEQPSLLEDAGLSLFAKASALAVPIPPGGECFQPGTSGTCLVAFHRYRARAGFDALVQNGIGFVRLQNPATRRPLNVFFTHMQANEPGLTLAQSQAVRAAQVEEARIFINQWAPSSVDQDTLLAGDLNVRGAPDAEENDPGFQEYRDRIAGDSGFGGLGLRDSHRLAASPSDPMLTFDSVPNSVLRGGRARLDYILFRPAVGTEVCVQQTSLRRGYHVETAPGDSYIGTDLSDHFALDATIGSASANCTPRTPVEVQAADASFARSFAGDRDAVHWFHQATGGTYSLSLGGFAGPIQDNSVDIEVYREDDLSEPLTAYLGSTHLRAQNRLQPPNRAVFTVDGPFFVQVRAHDPAFSGSYTLVWHRHRGASFDDAIALDPFTTLSQQPQLSDDHPEPLSTAFYSVVQHALDSGARQQLQFTTDGHPAAQLRIQLFNAARAPIAGLSTGYSATQQALTINATSSPISGAQQRLFFTVDRVGCSGTCSSTFNVSWSTNHRRLDLREMEIEEDADGITDDDDEVVLRVRVDGGAEQSFNLGQVHKESVKRLPATLRDIGFASQVTIRFTETDQGLGGADDVSEPRSINANDQPFNADDRDFTLDLPMHRGSVTGPENGLYHARAMRITRVHN